MAVLKHGRLCDQCLIWRMHMTALETTYRAELLTSMSVGLVAALYTWLRRQRIMWGGDAMLLWI